MHADVIAAMMLCLGGRAFRVYPRHRWLRADLALDQIGLILAIHGLGDHVYRHMLHMVGTALPRRQIAPQHRPEDVQHRLRGDVPAPDQVLSDEELEPADLLLHVPVVDEAADHQGAEPLPDSQEAGAAERDWQFERQADLNERSRRSAIQWLGGTTGRPHGGEGPHAAACHSSR